MCDERLGLGGRHAKVENQVLAGQFVDAIFEMLDPATKLVTLFGDDARGLMREIGADVAVDENDFAFVEGCFNLRLGLEAVACVEQRGEMRVYGFERAEFAVYNLAPHLSKPGVVLEESGGRDAAPSLPRGNGAVRHIH